MLKFPLSFAQQRLWLVHQYQGIGATYHVPAALHFRGKVNPALLRKSIDLLVERHETLRTTFVIEEDLPVQIISPALSAEFHYTKLEDDKIDDNPSLSQALGDLNKRPFDLASGPLIRFHILELAPESFVLGVCMHHIIADGWSMAVLVREIGAHYSAFCTGNAASLPPLPVQYADYSEWQRERLQGSKKQELLDYWTARLSNLPATGLALPADYERPSTQSYKGDTLRFELEESLARRLDELCCAQGVSMYMLLLSAYAVLLAKYSGGRDIAIGSPVANRNRKEIEGLIGFFVNTLAMRLDIKPEEGFAQLLQRTRTTTLEAYQHQDLPFEQLVEALNPSRDPAFPPLFQVFFALQNMPQHTLELPGISIRQLEIPNETAKFDLTLFAEQTGGSIILKWEYCSDLFQKETVGRIARNFATLLSSLCENPAALVKDLAILSPEEKQSLAGFNATYPDISGQRTFTDLFGKPISNTRIYILDDFLQPVPIGAVGRIYIAGEGLAGGYLNQAELAAEKFIANPFEQGGRLYDTGDPGKWLSGGNIAFLGAEDRKALPDISQEEGIRKEHVAPQTPDEEALAAIWKDALGVEPGVTDNFFKLGGHSLLAAQIINRVSREMNKTLSFLSFFANPTIRSAALQLQPVQQQTLKTNSRRSMGDSTNTSPKLDELITQIKPTTKKQLYASTINQRRLWYISQINPASTTQNVMLIKDFKMILDLDNLKKALEIIIDRHETFRTNFKEVDGQLKQKIHDEIIWKFEIIDLENENDKDNKAGQIIAARKGKSFNLSTDVLFSVTILKFDIREWKLVFVIHHILTDGWSNEILKRELMHIYNQLTLKKPLNLPFLRIQNKDYGEHQNELLKQGILTMNRDYWHRTLSGEITFPDLPKNREYFSQNTNSGHVYRVYVNKSLTNKVKELGKNESVSLYVILFTTLNILLKKKCLLNDIIICTPFYGRETPEIENVVGYFNTPLLLRTKIDEDSSFNSLMRQVENNLFNSIKHHLYPVEQLVKELNIRFDYSRYFITPVNFRLINYMDNVRDPVDTDPKHLGAVDKEVEYEIDMEVCELPNYIELNCIYRNELFDQEFIEELMENYIDLLNCVSSVPNILIKPLFNPYK